MKLLKTIERMIKESEEAYNRAVESFADEKTLSKLEKQYEDSLNLMEMYERMKKLKKDDSRVNHIRELYGGKWQRIETWFL